MIPVEKRGHSFKGIITYLTHPKRGDENPDPRLRRMVFTGNMESWKPRSAREVIALMAHFSRQDVRRGLMASAGVRGHTRAINTGKPPVMHLTLAFPPGADPDPQFVRTAVREALQSLEAHQGRTLADHQYAAFLHRDTAHWHIHVVVNLVDHRTGRLADPYRSQQKLQAWAYDWCRRHGFDVCKDRQEKYRKIENNKKAAKAQNIACRNQDGYCDLNGLPHHLYNKGRKIALQQTAALSCAQNAATIKKWTTARYNARQSERQELYDWYNKERKRIRAHFKPRIQAATALRPHPLPFTLDARQKQRLQAFFRRERSLAGKFINSLILAATAIKDDPSAQFIKTLGCYLKNADTRRSTFFRQQYTERRKLSRVRKIIEKQDFYIARLESTYTARKNILHALHGQQMAEERRAWSVLNRKRGDSSAKNTESPPLLNKKSTRNYKTVYSSHSISTKTKSTLKPCV